MYRKCSVPSAPRCLLRWSSAGWLPQLATPGERSCDARDVRYASMRARAPCARAA